VGAIWLASASISIQGVEAAGLAMSTPRACTTRRDWALGSRTAPVASERTPAKLTQ
jgi:hypothetical protein